MHRFGKLRGGRSFVLACTVAASTGCYHWSAYPSPVGASEALARKPVSEVRLVTSDSTVALRSVTFADGSFVGLGRPVAGRRDEVRIPLDDVASVRVRRLNRSATIAGVAGVALAVPLFIWLDRSLEGLECMFGCP